MYFLNIYAFITKMTNVKISNIKKKAVVVVNYCTARDFIFSSMEVGRFVIISKRTDVADCINGFGY